MKFLLCSVVLIVTLKVAYSIPVLSTLRERANQRDQLLARRLMYELQAQMQIDEDNENDNGLALAMTYDDDDPDEGAMALAQWLRVILKRVPRKILHSGGKRGGQPTLDELIAMVQNFNGNNDIRIILQSLMAYTKTVVIMSASVCMCVVSGCMYSKPLNVDTS